ncbi:MAG TPA: hypothetical protein VMG09_01005 [Bacteroidota bacterium]|nr:hypothetical protein [Bacteroidota bacterium]
MKSRTLEHLLSIVLVGLLFAALLTWYNEGREREVSAREEAVHPYLAMDSVDFSDAYHRVLFRETVEAFYPSRDGLGDSLLASIDAYRMERFTRAEYKSGVSNVLTMDDLLRLSAMYAQFIVVFLCALVLTSMGGRALAIYRFVEAKQGAGTSGIRFLRRLLQLRAGSPLRALVVVVQGILLLAAIAVLYSPAYVVAYALKGRLDLSSVVFLLLLAVLTNGALVNYAARYALLLAAASREGFVDTAVAKNLSTDWRWSATSGIPLRALLAPGRAAPGHVFHHIALQAEFQHRSSLKEHAAFLITGLIIIEMALNIQGHLGYDLLQNILYRRYDIVAAILFGMFLLVKVTALIIDVRSGREERRFANVT